MPEFDLSARAGLESVAIPGRYGALAKAPGVVITLITKLAVASVMARAGKTAELSARAIESFGIELPMTPKRVDGATIRFIWAGPDQWLAAAEGIDGHVFASDLRRSLAGLASITDQSDGRTIIRVSGGRVRQTLAKGLPIDLDPVSFGPGDTALTVIGHINAHFWQVDAAPTFEFAVFRSFADAFCEWLKEAGAEFGIAIAGAG